MEPMPPALVDDYARRAGLEMSRDELSAFARALSVITDSLPAPEDLLATPEDFGVAARKYWKSTAEDDPLNAIVNWCEVPGSGAGMLEGKRITVKDSVAVAGIPMTGGFPALADFVPATDSVVVQRVLRAGGDVVATTNMDCLGWAASGETSGYGPTINPHDPKRTAGGSSSGAAAALSYDGIDVAIGCDQGGSIRLPAAWCGVLGLKPTHGLVPYTGAMGIDAGVDHIGPLARSAHDLANVLEVIAGGDAGDPRQMQPAPGRYVEAAARRSDLRGIRVGLLREGFSESNGVTPSTARAVEDAVETMSVLGASAEWVSLPGHLEVASIGFIFYLEGMASLYRAGGQGHGWAGTYAPDLALAFGEAVRRYPDLLSPQARAALILGEHLTRQYHGALYGAAQNRLPSIRAAYDQIFGSVDVLVMPTAPFPAIECSPTDDLETTMDRGWSMLTNTTPFNVTGHPAISLPLSAVEGLPVGTMVVGPRNSETLLLEIAGACERAVGWKPAGATSSEARS